MSNEMHPQIKIMKQSQLTGLKTQRTTLDAEINLLETELGLKQSENKNKSAVEQFQAERDAAPSPFEVKK
jgi:hypothetical protein